MADEREKLRRAVRRGNAVPSTNILETEVRSQGAPNFKSDADPELEAALPTVAFWEWNYGVPQSDIEDFIEFLQDDEITIIKLICEELFPDPQLRQIEYRGTFISATSERGWYECRTVWAYRGTNPIGQWVDLLANDDFKRLFRKLRRRFANDSGSTERLMALLQLYTYPDDFVDEDEQTAAGQRALIDASDLD
jgi:hypothetical protein